MGLLLETLKSMDILAGLPDEAIERFMVLGRSTERKKGTVMWRSGDPPRGIIVPVTGEAKLTSTDAEGREVIESLRSSAEVMGLASALDGMPHASDAVVTRAGEFFAVSATSFRAFVSDSPATQAAALRALGLRLRRFIREREEMALLPVGQRLARFLLAHSCVRHADGAKILLSATQSEIAARLGTVREVVARSLGTLQKNGTLEKTPHGTFIHDWEALCVAAGVESDSDELRRLIDTNGPPGRNRTERFFLPMAESRGARTDRNPEYCAEHLGDLTLCLQQGCPGAQRVARGD